MTGPATVIILPSCIATLGGDAAIARVLVERGADVNRRDSEGNTVLMVRAHVRSKSSQQTICAGMGLQYQWQLC